MMSPTTPVKPSGDPTHLGERLDTPVRSIMRPGVVCMAADASLLQAKRALVRHGVHAILILDHEGARPVGWVTDRGLLSWLDHDLALVPAGQAITEPPAFIEPGASSREALERLSAPGVSHLVVSRVAGEAPQGVVAAMDLVTLVAGERQ
jgi:CBS domain-containing protein